MAIRNIYDQLKRDEGFRSQIYVDTVGKHTIGYGHNLDANPLPGVAGGITEPQGTTILINDVTAISTKLHQVLSWLDNLDSVRQGVLLNMAFNMGVYGLLNFHHMLGYTQTGDWKDAAAEMANSAWYNEVGVRASRLKAQLLTGIWF